MSTVADAAPPVFQLRPEIRELEEIAVVRVRTQLVETLVWIAVVGLGACTTSSPAPKEGPPDLYQRLLTTSIPGSSLPPKVQFVGAQAAENVSGAIGVVQVQLHDADSTVTDTLSFTVYSSDSDARNAYLRGKPVACSPAAVNPQPCGPANLVAPSGFTGEAYCETPDNSPALCDVRDGGVVIEASSVVFTNNPASASTYMGLIDRAESLALAAELHLRSVGG
jgi:hypothetical protein